MHRERLERLATLLENYRNDEPNVPVFDLASWGEVAVHRGGFLWLKKNICGTAACAVGLACLTGTFAAEGLGHYREGCDLAPTYRGKREWDAVEAFFDLTYKQAHRLFLSGSYRIYYGEVCARAVAARIRKMIAPRKRKPKARPTDISALTAMLDATQKVPVKVT